ncbi:hypothetical protein B0H34DRAFT_690965 [Crassisporium funariophilum]|nr:hypothetical protein B0H34DRAFT_690965 [Crassisporium funariophilum]
MHTAHGVIMGHPGGRFTCTFIIDDIMYTFSGSFASIVPNFTSNNTKLTYNSVDQLTHTRQFDGRVGPNNVKLTLFDGPEIDGVLDMPLDLGFTISGSGVWHAD